MYAVTNKHIFKWKQQYKYHNLESARLKKKKTLWLGYHVH